MILNHKKDREDDSLTWPQVERGDYLTGGVDAFKEGFALLKKYDLSFDLQGKLKSIEWILQLVFDISIIITVNWFQLKDAAQFLKDFPDTVIILDHLGCLKLGVDKDEDDKRIAEWKEGMRALAALPNVNVKISMLEYIRSGWQKGGEANDVVKALVKEVSRL